MCSCNALFLPSEAALNAAYHWSRSVPQTDTVHWRGAPVRKVLQEKFRQPPAKQVFSHRHLHPQRRSRLFTFQRVGQCYGPLPPIQSAQSHNAIQAAQHLSSSCLGLVKTRTWDTMKGAAKDSFVKGLARPLAAAALVLVAASISRREGLGLEKELLVAVSRAFVQLISIGFALQFVFAQKGSAFIIFSISVMISIAGYTAGQRAKDIPGSHHVATVAILVGTLVTSTALVVLRVFPFQPRYIIPIAGMLTGNAMTVTGATMKRFREDIRLQRREVEAALALGATPRQASLPQLRRSLATGMSPVIDTAKTVGLVALPGAMTGLIMGGASPLEAVQLQIVVMCMLIGAAALSGLTAVYLSQPRFFTPTGQLRPLDGAGENSEKRFRRNKDNSENGALETKHHSLRHSQHGPAIAVTRPRMEVRNLTLVTRTGERILGDVSFEVRPGTVTALVGPSGSGKSTLLRALNRLWEPEKGAVILDGEDVTGLDVVTLRRRVGMLFQTPALFDGIVADNVRYGPGLQSKTLTDSEVHELLQIAGLNPDFASKPVVTLSGGEAQRVSLARALANRPDCLLLDEPTSALDPAATRHVEDAILRLRDDVGMTVVLVSHSAEQVRRIADRVCLLVDGRIVENGSPADLFASPDSLARKFLMGELEAGVARSAAKD